MHPGPFIEQLKSKTDSKRHHVFLMIIGYKSIERKSFFNRDCSIVICPGLCSGVSIFLVQRLDHFVKFPEILTWKMTTGMLLVLEFTSGAWPSWQEQKLPRIRIIYTLIKVCFIILRPHHAMEVIKFGFQQSSMLHRYENLVIIHMGNVHQNLTMICFLFLLIDCSE